MSIPTTTQAWVVEAVYPNSFAGLKLVEVPIPELGEHNVLIKIEAVSLNFSDLMIPPR